jgi:hypothetical protein
LSKQRNQHPPKPEKFKLISAYWHANIIDGADRGFSIVLGSDLSRIAHVITETVEAFKQQPVSAREDFLHEEIFLQLHEASEIMWSTARDGKFMADELSKDDQAQVIVRGVINVAILEDQKILVADEYNGMHYIRDAKA